MNKTRERFINVVTVLLGLLTAAVLFGMAMYYYPRDILELDITILDETVVAGGEVQTHNEVFTKANAASRYDNALQCDRTTYFLFSVQANTEKRDEPINSKFTYDIPRDVTPSPPTCKIVVDGRHEVEILPFFTRTYTTRFESNNEVIVLPAQEE